ncbi:MAG TPA: thioredoxin family protein [Cytophagales bacterium]|nr:thioredoxin family protein [Cytophagales bacterium]HAA24374.1 thioredoxin family protein [Cytophagales bacterium]HAP61924.1 thioredoxin family protein [Cytophagales bacterium]
MQRYISTIFLLIGVGYLSQGQTLQPFQLSDATSGNQMSLNSFQQAKALVIVFTSNYCPYSKLYDSRLKEWTEKYNSANLPFIFINPNSKYHPEYESLEAMAERAEEKGYSVPYLSDPDQMVSNNLGATRTPEVFVLKKSGDQFRVVYRGALDDNPQRADDVTQAYLAQVLEAIVSGKPTPANQRPTGCMIKKG